jgi:hypothetical protein
MVIFSLKLHFSDRKGPLAITLCLEPLDVLKEYLASLKVSFLHPHKDEPF